MSTRDYELEPYAGKSGLVIDYNWITPNRGAQVFYIYTVEISDANGIKEVVLHEDELEPYIR